MDILSNFSENLLELLEDKKITAEQLGKSIGVDPSEIYRYLRKEYLPNLTNIIKIADGYGCSIDYLLGLVPFPKSTKFRQTPPFSESFKAILAKRGVSRYRLNKESEISINCIDNWYHGRYTPSLDKVIALAKHFDCSIDELLGREI